MTSRLSLRALGAGVVLSMSAGAAAAQSDLESAIEAALACRAVADDGARLACLDAAAGDLETARDRLVSENAEKKQGLLARFGLAGGDDDARESRDMETVEEFGAEGILAERQARLDQKLRQIEATTTRIAGGSVATLYLDNGQVWRQLRADNKALTYSDKDEPYPVIIKRSAFGNYMATVKGLNRTIRVTRVE